MALNDGGVLIDVAGVGYEVRVPTGTLGRAGTTPGDPSRVTLSVHTHVREDALELFGFANESERSVFRLLLSTPNVGPKVALSILSTLPPAELAEAVARQDLSRLKGVSGVGKKTAERLILELREKLPALPTQPQGNAPQPTADDRARLTGALTNMGYRPLEAERAVASLGSRVGKEPIAELLKSALASLA